MISHSILEPYDYVEDRKGWIYLVKGYMPVSGNVVVAPIYSPEPNRKKTKNIRVESLRNKIGESALSTGNDIELKLDFIKKHYNRSTPFRINSSLENDAAVRALVDLSIESNCDLRLFGSRRLNIDKPGSDWDFLILGCTDPNSYVKKLINTDFVRAFNSSEIETRVQRYKHSEHWATPSVLRKIFSKTTLYVKTELGEIGLFFAGNTPFHLSPIGEEPDLHSIVGAPLRNRGLSFSMPREITIRSEESIHTVRTVSWSLCGLELCDQETFKFDGLVSLGNKEWWFGSNHSKIQMA